MMEYFDILNNFKGFGDPEGKVWFIGIEEASAWSPVPETDSGKYKRYEQEYFWNGPEEGNEYTSVYDVMSKIMIGLGLANGPVSEYRDKVTAVRGKFKQ